MRPRLTRRKLSGFALPALAVAVGLLFTGKAGYIHAKAQLAQYLIADAWEETLAGEQRVKPWPWADTWPVARLRIEGNGDLFVLTGASGRNLAFGPTLFDGNDSPGHGLTVMAGHRDTHFSVLKDLKSNARVWLEDETGKWFRYRVTDHHVVDTTHQSLVADENDDALIMVTCWPFDAVRPGGPLRYVVTAVPDLKSGAAISMVSDTIETAVSESVATARAASR